MRNTALVHRNTAAVSLVLAGLLTVVGVLLMPAFDGSHVERLEAIAAAGTSAAVSAVTFTLAQLPFAVGLVGVAHVLRSGAPRLAALGATFAVLGAFGHAVHGGVSLTMLDMAADPAHHETYAAVLAAGEAGRNLPFLIMGLLGTVFAPVLIGVALWRAAVGPRWLPVVLIAFVLIEFAGSSLSQWAGYASGLLFLVGFLTLAVVVRRTPVELWAPAVQHVDAGSVEPSAAGAVDRAAAQG